MKVLITAFNSFGDLKENPSELIANDIKKWSYSNPTLEIIVEILKTEYQQSNLKMKSLVQHFWPDIIIMLGVAENATHIRLENKARNIINQSTPDNIGFIPTRHQINSDGPDTYSCSLPIKKIEAKIKLFKTPIRISEHAGDYLCNFIYYQVMSLLNYLSSDAICGFIHIPCFKGTSCSSSSSPTREDIFKAIITSIEVAAIEKQHFIS